MSPDSMVYLNGQFVPLADAKVSVFDRGFLFGDGVYELIPVYSRRPFRLQEHLRRLANSLQAIQLANPYHDAQWQSLIEQLIAYHPYEDQSLYIQVTRGVALRDHRFPPTNTPATVFLFSAPLTTPPDTQRAQGVEAVSATDNRWLRCDIKAVALLANVLLRQQAVEAGVVETLLFRDGFLTEGAASNIFMVKNKWIRHGRPRVRGHVSPTCSQKWSGRAAEVSFRPQTSCTSLPVTWATPLPANS